MTCPDCGGAIALYESIVGTVAACRSCDWGAKASDCTLPAETLQKGAGSHESALETELLFQLRAAGLPEPVAQYAWHPGRRFRADFAYSEEMLLIEVQGNVHRIKSRFESDCEKVVLMTIRGWRYLPISGKMLREGRAAGLIQQALKGDRG